MKKEQFNAFSTKSDSFIKKSKVFYALYVFIFVLLLIGMFIYQIVSFFMTFIMILTIMALLFHFVFKEYIFYSRKYTEFLRISKHKQFIVSDEVIDFFDKEAYQKLYDQDFELSVKNDVYIIASKPIDNSIFTLALAVYFNDLETEAVTATPKMLSNDLSGYILKPSIVKVVLLISNEFSEGEKDYLKYNSVLHRNTVVIGLEKKTKTLFYNYFLNGSELNDFLGELFKVDLTLDVKPQDGEEQ